MYEEAFYYQASLSLGVNCTLKLFTRVAMFSLHAQFLLLKNFIENLKNGKNTFAIVSSLYNSTYEHLLSELKIKILSPFPHHAKFAHCAKFFPKMGKCTPYAKRGLKYVYKLSTFFNYVLLSFFIIL